MFFISTSFLTALRDVVIFNGNLVSAFARNQSLIRVITEHDIGFRHPEGLAMGTKVLF